MKRVSIAPKVELNLGDRPGDSGQPRKVYRAPVLKELGSFGGRTLGASGTLFDTNTSRRS